MIRFLGLCAALLVLSGEALAAPKYAACAREKNFRTEIVVNLDIPEPLFNFNVSRQGLNEGKQKSHEEWLKSNDMQTVWKASEMSTLGEAAANWGTMYSMRLTAKPYDSYGTSYCPYFQKVEMNMAYLTTITIPKEFKKGGCMFNEVLAHEWRHHTTNVAVMKEITEKLKKDLPVIIAEIETNTSYVTRSGADTRFQQMQQFLEDAVDVYMKESLSREMDKRNALIDTPAEYRRAGEVMIKCQGK